MSGLDHALARGGELLAVIADETTRLAAGEPVEAGRVELKRRAVEAWLAAAAALQGSAEAADPRLAALAGELAAAASGNGRALNVRLDIAQALIAAIAAEARQGPAAPLVTYDGAGAARGAERRLPLARNVGV